MIKAKIVHLRMTKRKRELGREQPRAAEKEAKGTEDALNLRHRLLRNRLEESPPVARTIVLPVEPI